MAEVSFLNVVKWTDDQCREYLEAQRWPDGPVCPKCGAPDPYKIQRKSASKNVVSKLYRCKNKDCRKDYTATVGTIFEDSKIPLSKWFAAIYLMCASKKGMSAHQIHRELDITYKSAWFVCHRIREAMSEKDFSVPFNGTVEADETYVGGKPRGPKGSRTLQDAGKARAKKAIVFGIRERGNGGRVRSMVVPQASATMLRPILQATLDPTAHLMTDIHPAYRSMKRHFHHDMINHEIEYVRGNVHTQSIEGYWSLLKRGIYGTFHHVGVGYLGNYLNEFDYRFNSRQVSDAERFAALMGQVQGRVQWFCRNPQAENPFA